MYLIDMNNYKYTRCGIIPLLILIGCFTISLYFLILITTYYLAASNNQKKYEKFWKHIRKYAKAAGLLNPFVLAFGILLAIVKDLWALIICVVFVVAQIMMYITAGSKRA